jgi:Flp pilus assembly protein TadG
MRRKGETGNILLITALSLTFLMGFLGLAVDMGMMRYEKRLQQTAADAAAIAGANDLAYEGSGSVTCAAQNTSAADGFTDTSGGGGCANGTVSTCEASTATAGTVCVQVNNPPSYLATTGGTDPHNGDPNYVEVVVAAVHPTYFMGFLKIYTEDVIARAEATDLSGGTTSQNCMYTLGPPSNEIGIDPSGSSILNVTDCGIVDNGNFDPTGSKTTVNACSFGVSGSNTGNHSGNVNCNGNGFTPTYGMPTQKDPLAGTAPPTVGSSPINGCCASGTLNPGTYNGMSIGGGATVTFNPGIYVITGNDFSCGANSTISGYGVMFYFTNGATPNCQGTVTVNLGAPCSTSGCTCASSTSQSCYCPTTTCPSQYDGILMYQDANDTNTGIPTKGGKPPCPPPGSGSNTGPEIGGNGTANYWGVLYFPGDQLYMTGNSGTTMNIGATISDSMCLSGNAVINMSGTSGMPVPLPTLSSAVLVE